MDIAKTAEKVLVGSILISTKKMHEVCNTVSADDFSCINAQRSFIVATSLWKQKKKVDLVSIAAEDISLASYLSSAMSEGAAIGVVDSAKTVARFAKERRLNSGLKKISESLLPINERLDDMLKLYQREMSIERKDPSMSAVMLRYNDFTRENKKRGRLGIPTGFDFLEEKYIQYCPGHIWLLGAYTSVGKTAMAVQMLCNLLAMDPCPKIVLICAEMTEESMISRILGNFTGIYSKRIDSGHLEPWEEERVEECKALISQKPLLVYDDIYELSHIENVFRKAEMQGGVDIGVIDYVQNCRVKGIKEEYLAGAVLAKSLQQLTKEVRCTMLCLSQVSNDVGRGNTDQLEFKGAGEWAAVADVGIHLKKKDRHLKFLLKKNRHGALHEHLFEYNDTWSSLHPLHSL